MAANTVKLTGFSQLSNTFKQVKTNVQDRALVRMVASGANVVKKTARKIVQSKRIVKSGALLNNIVLKREHDVPPGVVQYNVGVRHGPRGGKVKVVGVNAGGGVKVSYPDDPYYWWWVEAGHAYVAKGQKIKTVRDHKQNKRVRVYPQGTRVVGKKAFLQPAFEQRQQGVLDAMQKSLSASLVNLV
jgi:HK97 gp10 family phage protein